jgi:hypothetical protein
MTGTPEQAVGRPAAGGRRRPIGVALSLFDRNAHAFAGDGPDFTPHMAGVVGHLAHVDTTRDMGYNAWARSAEPGRVGCREAPVDIGCPPAVPFGARPRRYGSRKWDKVARPASSPRSRDTPRRVHQPARSDPKPSSTARPDASPATCPASRPVVRSITSAAKPSITAARGAGAPAT